MVSSKRFAFHQNKRRVPVDVGASAAPLQLCLKADPVVEGQPREGSKIVLRNECKKRSNGTPIDVSPGTSDLLGGGGDSCRSPVGYYRISRAGDLIETNPAPAPARTAIEPVPETQVEGR
jgi:hypothetical protein